MLQDRRTNNLQSIFEKARVAANATATNIKNEIGNIREDTRAAGSNFQNRVRQATRAVMAKNRPRSSRALERSEQAILYSEEEAQLHAQIMTGQDQREEAFLRKQFMIEQEIVLEAARRERQNQQQQTPIVKEVSEKEEQKQNNQAEDHLCNQQQKLDRIRERNMQKREAIERKLVLIRERLNAQRKVDNSEGIATLRAAVAAS